MCFLQHVYYLMFDLTFTISFLLILKTLFYHSHKLYHPQPLANERTLSNDPSFITRRYTYVALSPHYLCCEFKEICNVLEIIKLLAMHTG